MEFYFQQTHHNTKSFHQIITKNSWDDILITYLKYKHHGDITRIVNTVDNNMLQEDNNMLQEIVRFYFSDKYEGWVAETNILHPMFNDDYTGFDFINMFDNLLSDIDRSPHILKITGVIND